MSDRIAVMNRGLLEQVGTPNEVYYHPRTSYVASFVGSANILREGQSTFAIRTENVLMNGERECTREAAVLEKSFAGGQLRILFRLPDGQQITASRYGIDADIREGSAAFQDKAPRSRDASTRDQSSFSALEYTARIMNGRRA